MIKKMFGIILSFFRSPPEGEQKNCVLDMIFRGGSKSELFTPNGSSFANACFRLLPLKGGALVRVLFLAFILLSSFAILAPSNSYAADTCTAKPDGTPTTEGTITNDNIITGVVNTIKTKLTSISQKLFVTVTADSGFVGAVRAAMTLYIAIYGILFMAGLVEIKFHDFIVTLFKVGVVGALLSASSWQLFNGIIVKFFNDGTDQLINQITSVAVGSSSASNGTAGAFAALDSALSKAISPNMIKTILASGAANIYGAFFVGMLAISVVLFMKSIIQAVWVYVMSLAMKTLLFGLAPIFIPCILFQRTKHLFDGWLNQIISASVLPVLLFVFLTFFVQLMDAAMVNVLHTPICWSALPDVARGSGIETFFHRFMVQDASGNWTPKTGAMSDGFPIDLVAVLTFLILAYIANSFNAVVIAISAEIAGVASDFTGGGNPVTDTIGKITSSLGGKK